MKASILLLMTILCSSNALFEDPSVSLRSVNNISCVVQAKLAWSMAMVPGSVWDFLNNLASSLTVASNLRQTLDQLRNMSTVWTFEQNASVPNAFDFCFVAKVSGNLSNGTALNSVLKGGFAGINIFNYYVQSRCRSATFYPGRAPVGYGACDPIPYAMYDNSLCICATNNCNVDYETCMASADTNQTVNLSSISVNMPPVPNITSCRSGASGFTYIIYYFGLNYLNHTLNLYNIPSILGYRPNNIAACALFHNAENGDSFGFSLTYEEYSVVFLVRYVLRYLNFYTGFSESSTSLAVRHQFLDGLRTMMTSTIHQFSQVSCICTTNNCNRDIASCAIDYDLTSVVQISTSTPSTTTDSSGADHLYGKLSITACLIWIPIFINFYYWI